MQPPVRLPPLARKEEAAARKRFSRTSIPEGQVWLPPVQQRAVTKPPWDQEESAASPMKSTHREAYGQLPRFRSQPQDRLIPKIREPARLTNGTLFDTRTANAGLTGRTAKKGEHEPLTTAITGSLQGHTGPLCKSTQRWIEDELRKRFGTAADIFLQEQRSAMPTYRTTSQLAHTPKQVVDRITYLPVGRKQ